MHIVNLMSTEQFHTRVMDREQEQNQNDDEETEQHPKIKQCFRRHGLCLAIGVILSACIIHNILHDWNQKCCTSLEIQGLQDVYDTEEMSTAIVQYHDKEGKTCTKEIGTATCNLTTTINQKTQQCKVKKVNGGHIDITFSSNHQGKHQLSVEVDGETVKGSPFELFFLKRFGAKFVPLNTITNLTGPHGIAFNKHGHLIAVEYRGHQVKIFNGSKLLDTFGSEGKDPGQLYYPCGVAVDDKDNILVADGRNHRIQKFSSNGTYITAIGKHGSKKMEFGFPLGIEIHPHSKEIYVTENENDRIQILNPDLTFSRYISGLFHQPKDVAPKDVAFDSQGNVYVADNEHHQIQVFTTEGKYLRKFGKEGKMPGELKYPSSIAIDRNDIVYVLDLYNYRVSVFTSTGKFMKSFGEDGHGEGQFKEARGIAVDREGNVYVSDRVNNRIQVF